ncbi:hypothetical protein K435DRAFT_811021 [Dendrothele bispora CBS 962.96]|uniref:Uncharacterized protein n=1 Tax=Dendrothele bispora (strain CBS 962.96) TaxID=1314807 RepID=A0A4S8KT97_DENBC|nr:hypothetical protein K435DRAFT_811021 [Dendrothele bispora CBS 962.96]
MSWDAVSTLLEPLEDDLSLLSLYEVEAYTPTPSIHMMTALNIVLLNLTRPPKTRLPSWAMHREDLDELKAQVLEVAGQKAFCWDLPISRVPSTLPPKPKTLDFPLFIDDEPAPQVVPQQKAPTPGPSQAPVAPSKTTSAPANDSRLKSVDRQIADRANQRPKARPNFKGTTARPSNLPGEPPVVISKPSVVVSKPPTTFLRDPAPKPVENKSGDGTDAASDSLALHRPPRAVAVKAKEALDTQTKNSRKRPREPSPEADDEYKDGNSDDNSSAPIKKSRTSKDAGPSKTSAPKHASSGTSKKTTSTKDSKKKTSVPRTKTPAPNKIDKGKRKATSEAPESEEGEDNTSPVVDSEFLKGRMALVTADLKKLETPPSFPGLETLPYLTPAEYIATDSQHARLFPSRPGRAPSTTEKDYPDVFIASHRLGAGYSLNDLVKTTRNIGAVRQVVADHKLPEPIPKLVSLWESVFLVSLVAALGFRAPSLLNLIVLSAPPLRRVNASACTFITTSGLLDTQKFNLGSEIAILRQQLANPAWVFHQLKASDPNFKLTPQLITDICQLAGWTSSYSVEAIETFLSQPAPPEDAYYHPAFASPSEIAPAPSYGLGDLFFPVGNKPSRIDVSPWGPFVDARNSMREEFTADQANGRVPSVITIPESSRKLLFFLNFIDL